MISLSRYSNYKKDAFPSETVGMEVSTKPIRLPRHISSWESKSHRNLGAVNAINRAAKICKLNANCSEATDLAVNILRYQLSDRASQQKHLENLRCNLEHRLAVAKAVGNKQLVGILQEEFNQLAAKL